MMEPGAGNPTINILLTTSTFPRWAGDAELPFVFELASHISSQNGFKALVLAPHSPGAKTYETVENVEIYRYRYFIERWQGLAYDGGILPKLKKNPLLYFQVPSFIVVQWFWSVRLIRKHNVRIVHANWIIPQGLLAVLLKKMYGIKCIVTGLGGDVFALRGSFLNKLKRYITSSADIVTVVSNEMGNVLKQWSPESRVEVIPMGIIKEMFGTSSPDSRDKNAPQTRRPIILFVGRLAEKKGIRYLFEALPQIIRKFPKATLMIVGGGVLRNELEALARKLDIDTNVVFHGPASRSDLPSIYANADVFVLPSVIASDGDSEGLPNVLCEAMFSSLPVIASNVAGVPDVIEHERTGLLVQQKNSGEIAQSILRLLEDPELRERLGRNARDFAEKNLTWDVIGRRYMTLYEELMKA